MTHHMKPLPLRGADLEASNSSSAARGTAGICHARESSLSGRTRLAVSLAIALRYRAGRKRAFLLTPAAPSSDV